VPLLVSQKLGDNLSLVVFSGFCEQGLHKVVGVLVHHKAVEHILVQHQVAHQDEEQVWFKGLYHDVLHQLAALWRLYQAF